MRSLEQPRAVARLGGVGPRRLPVLRCCGGRDVLRRSLGDHARKRGEEGVGDLAALTGVGGADAETECCGCGKKHGLHGLSPGYPRLARAFGFVIRLDVGERYVGLITTRDNSVSWHM